MSPHTLAFLVAPLTFASGLIGLLHQSWQPREELAEETRDLINRTAGLVATMSALVLGLLIASASNFYNTQKSGLELVSARALQLDGVLRAYGPEAQPARGLLRDLVSSGYEQIWQSSGGVVTVPTIEGTETKMDAMASFLNRLRPTASETQKQLLSRATELFSSITDQRLLMSLQLNNSLSWPLMTILVSWTSLLFFGFGMLARVNVTTVAVMAVGAFSVASATFLIVELSTPYGGFLRLSPDPVRMAIDALAN